MKAIIKNLPNKTEPQGKDVFRAEFYQVFKELTPLLLKLFNKIETEETFSNCFYEARITLIPESDEVSTTQKGNIVHYL